MKRHLPILVLLVCTIVAGIALGAVIKETKQGKSIEFYTNESGTTEKKAEITPAGVLQVNEIKDLAGTGTPPGQVPIGGMVAVMPSTHANVWQPPATGAIKDGFMRADGHTITAQNVTDGSLIPEGISLPNMVDRFTRGTAATSGTALGSDSVTPTGTVSQPTFTGDAEARSLWLKADQAISGTVKEHYHSTSGPGSTLAVVSLGTTNRGGGSFASTTHYHGVPGHFHGKGDLNIPSPAGYHSHDTTFGNITVQSGSGIGIIDNAGSTIHSRTSGASSFYHQHPNSEFSGSVGNTSGSNGDGSFDTASITGTASASTDISHGHGISGAIGDVTSGRNGDEDQALDFNANNNNMNQWAAAGSYTPSGTVSQPTFTGNSQDNKPAYMTVVWVIRVK